MKQKVSFIGITGLFVLIFNACTQQSNFPILKGPYLGQKPPGDVPELFMPGIISTGNDEIKICFSNDGRGFYYSYAIRAGQFQEVLLLYSSIENACWTEPKELSFSPNREICYQFSSPDGQKLYFNKVLPEEKSKDYNGSNIWYVENVNGKWSVPKEISFGEDCDIHRCTYPSVAANGNLYFQKWLIDSDETNSADIYVAKYENDRYLKPERLSRAINAPNVHECHPYIAPDESYIIFDSDISGKGDFFISFRDKNGNWMEAINLSEKMNIEFSVRRPFVTFDKKYLFFVSFRTEISQLPDNPMTLREIQELVSGPMNGSSDFYWVDAKVIEDLKPNQLK